MTAPDSRPLSGWIIPDNRRGTFTRVQEPEPGAIEADFLHVCENGKRIDVVAWDRSKPGTWWLWRDIITVVGEHELEWAWWEERPARMLATPADYVAAHGAGFCVVDWASPVTDIIGRVASVECATPALYDRLRKALIQQAMPRGLQITTRPMRRAT